MKTCNVEHNEIVTRIESKEKQGIPSVFGHINTHKGLRRGKLHGLIASTGAGKSTYIRSVVKDLASKINQVAKILVWLSEETTDDFIDNMHKQNTLNKYQLDTIIVVSELELSDIDKATPKAYLESIIAMHDVRYMIFDNITTSNLFYQDKTIQAQGDFVTYIKKFATRENIAIILVAHTGANVNRYTNRIINENDVRGSKTFINYLEFLYILQQFQLDEHVCQTLRVEKHRGYNVGDRFYILNYDNDSILYKNDFPTSYERFKEMFDQMHTRKRRD